jgi:hypothetical protein
VGVSVEKTTCSWEWLWRRGMSRLVFQEELLSDHEVSYDTEEEDDQESQQNESRSGSDDESRNENEDHVEKDKRNERNEDIRDNPEESDDESEEDEEENHHRNEFQELESDSEETEDEEDKNMTSQSTNEIKLNEYSSFLSKFLATKKTPQVPPPPQVIPLNDFILKEFALSERTKDLKRSREDREEGKKEDERSISSDDEDAAARIEQEKGMNQDQDEEAEAEAIPLSHSLTLFNLPYNMTTEEIEKISFFYGVKNVIAKLNIDKKTQRPSGSAQIFVQSVGDDAEEEEDPNLYLKNVIQALDGKDFRGRPVRVRSFEMKGGRVSFGGGAVRYFGGDDLSVKCNNCGKVGHRQADCLQEPTLPPCHFCAGTDHEPRMPPLLLTSLLIPSRGLLQHRMFSLF